MLPEQLLGKDVFCATELVIFNTTVRINERIMTINVTSFAINLDTFGKCALREMGNGGYNGQQLPRSIIDPPVVTVAIRPQ